MDEADRIEKIEQMVAAFDVERPRIKLPDTKRIYFAGEDQGDQARSIGRRFWLPVSRACGIFVCAYTAMFCIPAFTNEALARQPDRFSLKRLPLTIRSTSSFILDAFGYDRRTEREREVIYSPGPVISSNHAKTEHKERISNPAMAYFGVHLIRNAERGIESSEDEKTWHHDYLAGFFRSAGYPIPNRSETDVFVKTVDDTMAGVLHSELWASSLSAANELGTGLTKEDISSSLPDKSRRLFDAS